MVTISHYLILAAVLFSVSVAGIFINRKNVILLLMCIEIMLLAVNFNFIAFSRMHDDTLGQVFVLSRFAQFHQNVVRDTGQALGKTR